jgi:hypothetical protein
VAYGDLVLEYMGANSFKVLPTEQIVRRPSNKKTKTVIPVAAPVAAAKAAAAEAPVAASNGERKEEVRQGIQQTARSAQKESDAHPVRNPLSQP